MANYSTVNPGKFHLGYRFPTPVLIDKLNMETQDEYRVELKFKHSVIVGRTVYVGNVQVFYRRSGIIKVQSDAMYKSIVNEFDTFTSYNKIEAAVDDGEEITAMIEFGEKILQFKQNTLYIINVSSQIEVLESTHRHKGVNNPASVCKTDFGIAWANRYGCYLYDGRTVYNLLEKEGVRKIKESTWNTFLNSGSYNPMVGYFPKKRQLFVVDDRAADGNGSCYIYDMITTSWIKSSSAKFEDAIKSNFINDWNGDLVYATSATPKKWSDTPASSSSISFKTKDIDFGQPGVRKKIYKAYISYKGNGTNVNIQYSINGDTDTTAPFYRTIDDGSGSSDNTNSDTTPLQNVGTDDWVLAELKPVSSINNIYSFQLIITGTAAADFSINDISIIYRMKSAR